jgi:Mn-dependent DtxR family transcriptional regulator
MRVSDAEMNSAIVRFVGEFIGRHGYSPTQVEIAKHVGLSQPAVAKHLAHMMADGRVIYTRYKHRGIHLCELAEGKQ